MDKVRQFKAFLTKEFKLEPDLTWFVCSDVSGSFDMLADWIHCAFFLSGLIVCKGQELTLMVERFWLRCWGVCIFRRSLTVARLIIFKYLYIYFSFSVPKGGGTFFWWLIFRRRIWISFLELEALVNGWWYAKHVSYIRVTICLCAAINLRLHVDCSRFVLSYPSYCPPTLNSCCNNGHWPPHRWLSARGGQQKGPVDPYARTQHNCTYTHLHCLMYNDKRQHTQSWGRQRASWSMTNCSPRQQAPV